MKTKPTPGPYRVVEYLPGRRRGGVRCGTAPEGHMTISGDGIPAPRFEINSSVEHMQNVMGSGHGGCLAVVEIPSRDERRAQALANARLLAAAPALFASLKETVEYCAECRSNPVNAPCERCERAHAALAKAQPPESSDPYADAVEELEGERRVAQEEGRDLAYQEEQRRRNESLAARDEREGGERRC